MHTYIDSNNPNLFGDEEDPNTGAVWDIALVLTNDLEYIKKNIEDESDVEVVSPDNQLLSMRQLSFYYAYSCCAPFFKSLLRQHNIPYESYVPLLKRMVGTIEGLHVLTDD